jgi:hypothetical protein
MVESAGQLLGDQRLEQRIAEIKDIIERMDFRWDQGFITDHDFYLEQRVQLQQKLEKLTPIPDDELQSTPEVLSDFGKHWDALSHDHKAQQDCFSWLSRGFGYAGSALWQSRYGLIITSPLA